MYKLTVSNTLTVLLLITGIPALSQAPAPAAAPKPAASKPAKRAGSAKPRNQWNAAAVVDMLKANLGEDLIVLQIQQHNQPLRLSPAEMIELKNAGASDRLIALLSKPSGAVTLTPPEQVATAPAEQPRSAPVEVMPLRTPPTAQTRQKRSLFVEPFEYATVRQYVRSIFGNEQDIGAGIRALLVHRIQKAGHFTVVERAKLETLIREQDMGQSDRVQPGTGPGLRRIRGAQAILLGDIVVFGRDDKKSRLNIAAGTGPSWWDRTRGKVEQALQEEKAVVGINFRLVDAATSELIFSSEARGESSRSSRNLGGFFRASGAFAGGSVDMTSSNFESTIIGEATIAAVDKIAADLAAQANNIVAPQMAIEGRVADVTGSTVTLNVGGDHGVQPGDRFQVLRIIKQPVDPLTRQPLDPVTAPAGEVVISYVGKNSSSGAYTGSPAQINFIARKQ